MVSAFAARQRIVLGQVKVSEKSNEIVAIPALLDMMSIKGAVVTIDAMACQRDIVAKKADYIVALKGNQATLREDVEVFVDEQKALKYKDTTVSTHETVEGDRGQIEIPCSSCAAGEWDMCRNRLYNRVRHRSTSWLRIG